MRFGLGRLLWGPEIREMQITNPPIGILGADRIQVSLGETRQAVVLGNSNAPFPFPGIPPIPCAPRNLLSDARRASRHFWRSTEYKLHRRKPAKLLYLGIQMHHFRFRDPPNPFDSNNSISDFQRYDRRSPESGRVYVPWCPDFAEADVLPSLKRYYAMSRNIDSSSL